MRTSWVVLGFAASVFAQAVTDLIVPSSTPPAGCLNSREGSFTITVVNVTNSNTTASVVPTRRSPDIVGRDLGAVLWPRQTSGVLTLTLEGGVLLDQANRTGYIASNYQFQFDGPPQAGAIYTAGWGICANGSLSLGGQAIFYQCLSGEFYNLYDRNWAVANCVAIYLYAREGAGQAYSTAPPGPEITGASENDIPNGGGTQSLNSTAFTFGQSAASTAATLTSSDTAESTSGSTTGSATGSQSSAASSSSSSGGAVMPTSVPQQVFAWAAGIMGAIVFI